MTATDASTWPSIADVVRATGLSQSVIHRHVASGKLFAVRTRLGWLVEPESVAALQAERAANPRVRRRLATLEEDEA
jgi:hypothetical protein